jgi:hypothetical protein
VCECVLMWCFFSSMARVQFHRSAPLLDAFDTAIYGWSNWSARVIAMFPFSN